MKKILLISNRVMHYRVSVYNYLARRFAEYGYEFVVRSNELQRENPHPVKFDFKEVPFTFANYRREIREIEPEVVILFLHLKDRILWPLIHWLRLRKTPMIHWTKGANLDDPDSRFKYLIFNYVHGMCDRLLMYSAHQKHHIRPGLRDRIFVANNTVNFDDFPDVPEDPEEIKKSLGIPFKKVVLAVGRMGVGHSRKKIEHLIEVFKDLDRSDVGLVIVGSGVDEEMFTEKSVNIKYLGEIFDPENIQISRIFKMADLFSIPGHVGLGLNQAFYWGLPMVTEEGLQPPEIHYLKDGQNGYIVPENDIKALRDRILDLVDDDDLRARLSRKARETIFNEGSIENMFTGFKTCVESLFDEQQPSEKGERTIDEGGKQ